MKNILLLSIVLVFVSCDKNKEVNSPSTTTEFYNSLEYQNVLKAYVVLNPSAEELRRNIDLVEKDSPKEVAAFRRERDRLLDTSGSESGIERFAGISAKLSPEAQETEKKMFEVEGYGPSNLDNFEKAVAAFAKKYPDVSPREFADRLHCTRC